MKSYLGVDISKVKFDAHYEGDSRTFEQNKKGYRDFAKWVKALQGEVIVVCEASGGYEKPFVATLAQQGIAYHVAHPNKIKGFIKACGRRAKTDPIDAKMIARYAMTMQVEADEPLSKALISMRSLVKRREELLKAKHMEKARLDKASGSIVQSIKRHIRYLDKEIKKIEQQLAQQVQADEATQQRCKQMASVPGVGALTAQLLAAYLPELGSLGDKQIAALVGVAPYNHDSGSHQGQRFIQGGRAIVRRAMYMVALVASRWNPDMKVVYERLREAGKPAKVALVAVMRKLLCLLNVLVKRDTPWVNRAKEATT